MIEAYTEAKDIGLGKILRVDVPFDKALEALKAKGVKSPITARDLAYVRINSGENSLSENGSYTREGCIYGKSQAPLVIMNSPLLNQKLAVQATEANRNDKNFQLQDKKRYENYLRQAERDAKKEPEKRKVLVLPSKTNFTISPEENWDTARGIFKDQAESYFKYLSINRINSITFYTFDPLIVDKSEAPIATQLWLCRLVGNGRSDLDGNGRYLCYSDGVRGVLSGSAEGTSLPYTQREVAEYSQLVQGIKDGKYPNSKLEKVVRFLDKLGDK